MVYNTCEEDWETTNRKLVYQTQRCFRLSNQICHAQLFIIYNFSSSKEEDTASSYGPKYPVPHQLNQNGIMTEFEYFYQ